MKKLSYLLTSLLIFAFDPAWGKGDPDLEKHPVISAHPSVDPSKNSPRIVEIPTSPIVGKQAAAMGWGLIDGNLLLTVNGKFYEFPAEERRRLPYYCQAYGIESFSIDSSEEMRVRIQFGRQDHFYRANFYTPQLEEIARERVETLAQKEELRGRSERYKRFPLPWLTLNRKELQALADGRAVISTDQGDYELSSEDQEDLTNYLKMTGVITSTKITQDAWGVRIISFLEVMKMECAWRHSRPLKQVIYEEEAAIDTNMKLNAIATASSNEGSNPPPSSQDSSKNNVGGSTPPPDIDSASKMVTEIAEIVSDLGQQVAGRTSRVMNAHLSSLEEAVDPVQNSLPAFETAPLPIDGPPTEPPSSLMESAPTIAPVPMPTPVLPPVATLVEPVVQPALIETATLAMHAFANEILHPQQMTQAVAVESPLRCHPRDGGDPALTVFLQACEPELMPLKEWLYNTKQRFEVWVPAVAGMTVGKVETFIVKESFYPQAPLRVNVGGDKYAKLKLCHEKQNIPGLEMQPNFRRIPHPLKVLPYQVEEQGAKLGASVINTAMMVFVLLVFLGDNGIAAVTNIMASLTVLSFLVDRCFAMIGFYAKVALSTIDPYRPVRRNELQKMGMAVWEAGCTLLFGHPLPRFKLAYNS